MSKKDLMEILRRQEFDGFASLARFLREEVAQMSREQLGRAMGYAPLVAYAVVQNIETGKRVAGIVSTENYLQRFPGLDLRYISDLVGRDRAAYLYRQLVARSSRRT